MARTKSVKVEEKTAEVVEQKEPETETKAEVDNSSAEEVAAPEINSVDGENCENGENYENGEAIGAQCVEGGEPEIILGQTKPEDLPTDGAVDENEEVNPETNENVDENKEETSEEDEVKAEKVTVADAKRINSVIVTDPMGLKHRIHQSEESDIMFNRDDGQGLAAIVKHASNGERVNRFGE